jgi:glycosyltransferase involved in cell wall biosynthesis
MALLEKVSVVVPCYPPHIPHLNNSIQSLLNNTERPDEIIIALSETSLNDGEILQNGLRNTFKYEDIKVFSTTKKQFAGENRNRGGFAALNDIIIFFDADDASHTQKIEITKKIFKEYQPSIMLHGYTCEHFDPSRTYDVNNIGIVHPEAIYEYTFGKIDNPRWIFTNRYADNHFGNGNPHHGHATIHKDTLLKVQYTNHSYGEDSIFCVSVLKELKNIIYTDSVLVNYNISRLFPTESV